MNQDLNISKCPICDNYKSKMEIQNDMVDNYYQVACQAKSCNYKSKLYASEEQAIDGWNKRDKYDGIWDESIVMTKESREYFDMIMAIKGTLD